MMLSRRTELGGSQFCMSDWMAKTTVSSFVCAIVSGTGPSASASSRTVAMVSMRAIVASSDSRLSSRTETLLALRDRAVHRRPALEHQRVAVLDLLDLIQVDGRNRHAFAVGRGGHDHAPGVDHGATSHEADARSRLVAVLAGGHHEELVLARARPQE